MFRERVRKMGRQEGMSADTRSSGISSGMTHDKRYHSRKESEKNEYFNAFEQSDWLCRSFNYDKTIRLLDIYYGIVKRKILRYQSSTTGLFPRTSEDTNEAYVRDSIYCAASIWSLYQAYRRIDNDRGKSYELGQSAVKCMRGILICWLNQANLMESFKKNQIPELALHSKFHLVTGEPIASTDNFGHLQMDIPSLYLIYLVQMITSGLQIVYSMDEVCFIQNLVYYIERGYRTPDFGIWERGTKYNNGTPEIHSSSIGMVKAALESINGCNLFGEKGTSWSVVYVDIDAHNRNRSIFETLLPRESSSKNTDAALLTAISYPAFATHDEQLYDDTKDKVIRKLKGEYGFKRFLRDGFGTVLENRHARFYNNDEVKNFGGIESEWPLFFIFMIIDGVFKSIPEQVTEYQKILHEKVQRDRLGEVTIPMYFYVPEDSIEFERHTPNSSSRAPNSATQIFLWGQALYVISQLLVENLLHINELDPIRRYLPSFCRPKRSGRYSAFQGTATDLVVQIVLIAESMRLQAMMATYGIQTQTPHEVEPIQIWSQNELVKAYQFLGVNDKLHLSGRPPRPIGALGTSKLYRLLGNTVLCYPLVFEIGDFYLSHDMALLIDDIKNELRFVGRYWRLRGRPTFCILLREEHMRDTKFREMLDFLAMLKSGVCDEMQVQVGRVQNIIAAACMEHLDFLSSSSVDVDVEFTAFTQVKHKSSGYQSLTDIPKAVALSDLKPDFSDFVHRPTEELVGALACHDTPFGQSQLLGIIYDRHGPKYMVDRAWNARDRLELLARETGLLRNWQVVRYCTSKLKKVVDSISPFITAILVNGKQISLGVVGQSEVLIKRPINPGTAKQMIYNNISDPYHAVLQQEVLLYTGKLILTHPDFFTGILKLRIGWIIQAMTLFSNHFEPRQEGLESFAPSEIRKLLYQVLNVKDWRIRSICTPLIQRQIEGFLGRVPDEFYNRMWGIMTKAPGGVVIAGHHLPQQPTISNMTMQEMDFSILIEDMLNNIPQPDHRQITVELIMIVSLILERNPELVVESTVDMDKMIHDAIDLYQKDHFADQVKISFYTLTPSITSRYLARSVVNIVLKETKSNILELHACDIM